jgi:hypothetical protein
MDPSEEHKEKTQAHSQECSHVQTLLTGCTHDREASHMLAVYHAVLMRRGPPNTVRGTTIAPITLECSKEALSLGSDYAVCTIPAF